MLASKNSGTCRIITEAGVAFLGISQGSQGGMDVVGPSCPLTLRTQGTTIKSTNARDTQKPCGSPQSHKSVWALIEPPPCQALWQHTTYMHALASPTKSRFKVGLFNLTSNTRHQCGEVGSSGPSGPGRRRHQLVYINACGFPIRHPGSLIFLLGSAFVLTASTKRHKTKLS